MGSNQFSNFSNPEIGQDSRVSSRLQDAPYFKFFTDAKDKAVKTEATPYVRAYLADNTTSVMPNFVNPYAEEQTPKEPIVQVAPIAKAKSVPRKVQKKGIVIIIVALLALLCAALPFVSSLGFVEDYIDIGQDILTIDSLFSQTPTLESITAELPLIILSLYILFAVLTLILSLASLFSSKRIGLWLPAFIVLVLGIGYLVVNLPDLLTYFNADGLLDEYGKLAMIALPFLTLLISKFRYKKQI